MESNFFMIVIIMMIVYILLREMNCWYWKINVRNNKLDKINDYLELLVRLEIEKTSENEKYMELFKSIQDSEEDSLIYKVRKISVIKYPDGSIYYGEVKEDVPDGKGKMTNAKGEIFKGKYRMGIPYGSGILIDPSAGTFQVYIEEGEVKEKKKIK